MSDSSPEQRPFLTKPSPLLSDSRDAPDFGPNSGRIVVSPQNPGIRIFPSPEDGKPNVRIPKRYHRSAKEQTPNVPSKDESEQGARRRARGDDERDGTGTTRSDFPATGHRSSFSHFQAADLEDLIGETNLDNTFQPGSFAVGQDQGGSTSKVPPQENILDRSPTPFQYSAKGGSGRSRKKQKSNTDGSYDRARSRHDLLEEASGNSFEDLNQAIAKTFVRPEPPTDLLDYPVIFHPRVTMNVSITQPLYVGGGFVGGRFNIHIRGTRLDDIRLGRVSIDIVGVEELSFTRKTMFMSIASELIDEDHPPPAAMLTPSEDETKAFWKIKPSRSFLPFRINLPLNVGPGPFHSVRARIRYVIHGTILVSINGNNSVVRCCRDIRIISAIDPEVALLPLETPLLATEEHALRWGGHKTLKVTAGLHRAVWVSGTAAYADVNIINNTNRKVKSIKCKLRRHILAYKNTVALAENKSAGHLRVPNWIEKKTLSHSELNVGSRWRGVKGSQLDVVTCEIDIPRNQLSVKMGRYFEVKYFIDIAVCTPAARSVRCQLPVTIVHMNSLDVMPNDLANVARAIANRYGKAKAKSYSVGRAFVAPREKAFAPLIPQPSRKTVDHLKKHEILQPQKVSTKAKETARTGTAHPTFRVNLPSRDETVKKHDTVKNPESAQFQDFMAGIKDPRNFTTGELRQMWDDYERLFKMARRRSSTSRKGSKSQPERQGGATGLDALLEGQ